MRASLLLLLYVLAATRVGAEDPKPSALSRDARRVEKAQRAIDDLLVGTNTLHFVSRGGKMLGMDSDSKILLTTNQVVEVVEYGYAIRTYTGEYAIDTKGVISLKLKGYRSTWPQMALWLSEGSYYLYPISGRSGFTIGDRAGASETPGMKPFWPFKLVGHDSTPTTVQQECEVGSAPG